jgi:hypothetical protein
MGENQITAPPSVTCPFCHRTSYHLRDIKESYCNFCHDWHQGAADPRASNKESAQSNLFRDQPRDTRSESAAFDPK